MADIFLARGKACTLAANYKQCTCNKRRTAFAHRERALGPRRTGGKGTNNRFISLTGRPPPAAHLPNVKEPRGTTLSRHMTRSYKQQLEQPCRSTAPQSLPEAPRVASQCTSVCGRAQLLSRRRALPNRQTEILLGLIRPGSISSDGTEPAMWYLAC